VIILGTDFILLKEGARAVLGAMRSCARVAERRNSRHREPKA
jgi:hypothetical protein